MDCKAWTDRFYMAFCVYREARGEQLRLARIAVAWSIMERANHPRWWGSTISGVVTKPWQYSSLTDPKDPQLSKVWPLPTDPSWQECWEIAGGVIDGSIPRVFAGGTHYHDTSIERPKAWGDSPRFCGQVGRLKFYDVEGIAAKATA